MEETVLDILEEKVNIDDLLQEVKISSNIEKNELSSEGFEYTLSLRQSNIDDEKSMIKFIKSVENMIRNCPEYKLWVSYVHEVLGFNKCSITNEPHSDARSDIHHTPFTLYDIVKAVIYKKIDKEIEFCSMDIATEVIELHYQTRIGYCMLLKSIHEKVHNGTFLLPMSFVKGDYQYFYSNYVSFLPTEDIENIDNKMKINEDNCNWKGWIKTIKDNKDNL